MSAYIPKTKRRVIVGAVIAAALAVGCGVAFATSSPRGKYEPRLQMTVPEDKASQIEHSLAPGAPHSQADATTQAKAVAAHDAATPTPGSAPEFDRIPGRMISADTPVPISPELIDVQNGWMASDGKTLVAVYAGVAGDDPGKGRFVIIRQDLAAGSQTMDVVDVPGAGAVSITDAPKGAGVETSAQRGRIGFRGPGGWKGVLDLDNDRANRQ